MFLHKLCAWKELENIAPEICVISRKVFASDETMKKVSILKRLVFGCKMLIISFMFSFSVGSQEVNASNWILILQLLRLLYSVLTIQFLNGNSFSMKETSREASKGSSRSNCHDQTMAQHGKKLQGKQKS